MGSMVRDPRSDREIWLTDILERLGVDVGALDGFTWMKIVEEMNSSALEVVPDPAWVSIERVEDAFDDAWSSSWSRCDCAEDACHDQRAEVMRALKNGKRK